MNPHRLSIVPRFRQFITAFSRDNLLDWTLILDLIGWIFSLGMIAINLLVQGGANSTIFLIIHTIFLFRLVKDIIKTFQPPLELLLILFLLFLLLLQWNFGAIAGAEPDFQSGAALGQIILIAMLALIFSLILVQNNEGKRGTIIWFGILGVVGINFFQEKNNYLILLYQIILFFSLLQKTRWLEALTKLECWIYLVITVFLLNRLVINNPYVDYDVQKNFWHALPYFFYLMFKLYLLAIVVKIPIVLIYNHARLARKLKISGLFQSTFPQLIQFILLLSFFYIFISGFQARNLRTALDAELRKIEADSTATSVRYFKLDAAQKILQIADYLPVRFDNLPGETAVIGLTPQMPEQQRPDSIRQDYFLFFESSQPNDHSFYLVKLDSFFLTRIGAELHYLTGTSLWSSRMTPGKWSRTIYQSDFFAEGDFNIKIFPFAFIPQLDQKQSAVALDGEASKSGSGWLDLDFLQDRQLILGRAFLPIWPVDSDPAAYWMLDIILELYPGQYGSGMIQVIAVLILLYILLNSIVIQRVIKFGEQINRIIVQKFGQLQSGIHEISAGNLDYKIQIEGEDEFVELADRFNQMGDRLKQNIAEAREKERLLFELQSAREVQLSLLPTQLPAIPGYQLAASLETANEVGGDFYDIFPLEDNRFLFTIGDVSGKGSSAAFYMAQCLSLIRFSHQFTADPFEIAARLNNYFATTVTDRQIFITAIIGILDLNTHQIQFIRAGHTEPILISPGESPKIKILKARGLGIGLAKSTSLFEKSTRLTRLSLQPGDTLLLYTDGVIEANRPTTRATENQPDNLVIFGEERLLALLKQHHNLAPQGLVQVIEHELAQFYAEQPRIDDHTLFVIQRSVG